MINSDLNAKNGGRAGRGVEAEAGHTLVSHRFVPVVAYMDSLKNEKGADWVRVPFKGGGEATNAILGGSTPIGLIGLGNVVSKSARGR